MAKTPKQPGRIRQLITVYKMTAKVDKTAVPWALLAILIGVLVGVGLSLWLAGSNVFLTVMYLISGSLLGIMAALVVMARKAERAAYSQIQGQTGATGAVLGNSLRRGYVSSEMPVSMNPRTQEAVYRVVGPAGIVLIGEGSSKNRAALLVEDEKRKVMRVAPGVPVHMIYTAEGETPLHLLSKELYRLPKLLSRSEISTVRKRLEALGTNLPIPKGIDPRKFRAPRR
jgi:F0F1-type ATP synthase assembly protein I